MWIAAREREKPPEYIFSHLKQCITLLGGFNRFRDIPDTPLLTKICLIYPSVHAHTRYYPCI